MTKAKVLRWKLSLVWMSLAAAGGPAARAEEPPAATPGPRHVIVQPGYAGSSRDAEAFLRSLDEHLAAKAGLEGVRGEYFNEPARGLEAIARTRPSFGLVSLGFYLEHRRALGLTVLLQAKPFDNLVLVVRGGEGLDAKSLEGKPVAGGPLYDRKFLERVAFHGKGDPASWDARPVLQVSRALRDLVNKKSHAAVVMTGRDYRALSKLHGPKTLEIAAESAYHAPALLVAFGSKPEGQPDSTAAASGNDPGVASGKNTAARPSEETARKEVDQKEIARKVRRAFSELAQDATGRKVLDTMGAEGFEELTADELKVLSELEGKYAAQEKK